MTNYDKKRKRQNGRQDDGGLETKHQRAYRQGYFDGQSALIQRLTDAGVLPRLEFKMESKTKEEFAKDYPNE